MIWPISIATIFIGVCLYSVWDAFLPDDNDEPRSDD